MGRFLVLVAALHVLSWRALAVDLDITSPDSIKEASATMAWGLVKFYTGNNTGDVPGNLPDPYYWWQAGAMFGSLLDYWAYTGDESYNNITYQALWHQRGDDYDYMPDNQTRSLGNDDQGFWALTAMSAAELNFTNPPDDEPGWLGLTQGVFNEYVTRWDEAKDTCGGGLRWQIFTFNNGYNYKNSISNGCFFNIASRLARFTGNTTYQEWAEKIFDWEVNVGFISDTWQVRDGAGNAGTANCTEINGALFSYNAGIFLHGAAYMYNLTESDTWKNRVQSLVDSIATTFFTDGIMWELPCEATATSCNNDQRMFKGFLSRWMATTAMLAPFVYDTIMPLLKTTAVAAAKHCVSHASDFKGHPGTACTFSWFEDSTYEDSTGVGEQMNAMSLVMSMLVDGARTPYTSTTGGSSSANIDGGASDTAKYQYLRDITTADRVGAGIVTTLMLGGLVAALVLMNLD
ncbi:putative Family 76 glycosyl hydrolase [Seiridium cardinale]|uniref:Mannan endo-1,6-alpha-mannosidase n=1 Tax=Seiridium cardinale TaxID=138064 RepID=A0ABR2XFB2_9PEZI